MHMLRNRTGSIVGRLLSQKQAFANVQLCRRCFLVSYGLEWRSPGLLWHFGNGVPHPWIGMKYVGILPKSMLRLYLGARLRLSCLPVRDKQTRSSECGQMTRATQNGQTKVFGTVLHQDEVVVRCPFLPVEASSGSYAHSCGAFRICTHRGVYHPISRQRCRWAYVDHFSTCRCLIRAYHRPLTHVALSRNCMSALGHRWATSRLRAVGSPDVPILLCNLYSGMVAETRFVLWLTCRPRSHTTAGVCRPFSALHWAATVQYTWLSRRRRLFASHWELWHKWVSRRYVAAAMFCHADHCGSSGNHRSDTVNDIQNSTRKVADLRGQGLRGSLSTVAAAHVSDA